VGCVRIVSLLIGVLCCACGSAEHGQFEPAREQPQQVDFESTINVCPAFQGSAASPIDIPPDQPSQILVLASDPDGLDSKLQFQWSADSGSFSRPKRSLTEYRCGKPGPMLLKVVARDSEGCESSLSVNVTCLDH